MSRYLNPSIVDAYITEEVRRALLSDDDEDDTVLYRLIDDASGALDARVSTLGYRLPFGTEPNTLPGEVRRATMWLLLSALYRRKQAAVPNTYAEFKDSLDKLEAGTSSIPTGTRDPVSAIGGHKFTDSDASNPNDSTQAPTLQRLQVLM